MKKAPTQTGRMSGSPWNPARVASGGTGSLRRKSRAAPGAVRRPAAPGLAAGCAVILALTGACDRERDRRAALIPAAAVTPPTVTLVLSPDTIRESGGTSTVTATLNRASGAATTVEVSVAPVAPAVEEDYTLSANTTLEIAAGGTASTGAVTITAVDNTVDAPNLQVTVSGAVTSTARITGPSDATLTIEDDDEGPSASGWVRGTFLPAETFKNQCQNPRTGQSPLTGADYPDVQGRTVDENNWLRSWSDDTYLWYDEIVDRDPGLYDDPLQYFDLLKTTQRTPSGAPKDQFHFTWPTDAWIARSQSGQSAGYGAAWSIIAGAPPREAAVAYTDPDTPAADAGIPRGARIITVDGIDFVHANDSGSVDGLNAALYPASAGETHAFEFRNPGAASTYTVDLTAEIITSTPVQRVGTVTSPAGARVGYMLFNSYIQTAEAGLVDAIETFRDVPGGIEDLVVDMRYNGGGYLYIASQLGYMIAGEAATTGQVFERLQFNDKHPETNPVTGNPLLPFPFLDETVSPRRGQPLPALDLRRVFVLGGANTCSASESLINSLRGIDVEVILIGEPTCGKPYGFYATDNCGTSYFTIQFRGVNAKGFGDYSDGFVPFEGTPSTETQVPGCRAIDDLDRPLGDPAEARLATALSYRDTGSCPAAASTVRPIGSATSVGQDIVPRDGRLHLPPWLTNRLLRD